MQNHESNRVVSTKCRPMRKIHYLLVARHGIRYPPCVLIVVCVSRTGELYINIKQYRSIPIYGWRRHLEIWHRHFFILGGIKFERISISEEPRFVLHHPFIWLAKPFWIWGIAIPNSFDKQNANVVALEPLICTTI